MGRGAVFNIHNISFLVHVPGGEVDVRYVLQQGRND